MEEMLEGLISEPMKSYTMTSLEPSVHMRIPLAISCRPPTSTRNRSDDDQHKAVFQFRWIAKGRQSGFELKDTWWNSEREDKRQIQRG